MVSLYKTFSSKTSRLYYIKVHDVSLTSWSFEYTLACHISTILIYRCCEYYYQVWARAKAPARLASESLAGRPKMPKINSFTA